MSDYLYVCQSSSGLIKVGRSKNPLLRIASHRRFWETSGERLINQKTSDVMIRAFYAETLLINICAANASHKLKKEWFSGLDFDLVVEWMNACTKHTQSLYSENVKPVIPLFSVSIRLPDEARKKLQDLLEHRKKDWLVKFILREHRKTFGETK